MAFQKYCIKAWLLHLSKDNQCLESVLYAASNLFFLQKLATNIVCRHFDLLVCRSCFGVHRTGHSEMLYIPASLLFTIGKCFDRRLWKLCQTCHSKDEMTTAQDVGIKGFTYLPCPSTSVKIRWQQRMMQLHCNSVSTRIVLLFSCFVAFTDVDECVQWSGRQQSWLYSSRWRCWLYRKPYSY